MKVVIDPNVIVSGLLLPRCKAGHILKAWQDAKITIVVSDYLLDEIRRVLLYPKIVKRLKWDEYQVNQFIDLLSWISMHIKIREIENLVVRDQSDYAILATLIQSQANYLVTGDEDLLCLQDQYAIITVDKLYQELIT